MQKMAGEGFFSVDMEIHTTTEIRKVGIRKKLMAIHRPAMRECPAQRKSTLVTAKWK